MFRFSIARMIRRTKPRSATITLRPITPGGVQSHPLEQVYLTVVRAWAQQARLHILPAYAAALAEPAETVVMVDAGGLPAIHLSAVLEEVHRSLERLHGVTDVFELLHKWAEHMEKWHRTKWHLALQPHNVSLTQFIGPEDVADTVEMTIRQNVSLVRNVSETIRRAMEQVVFAGFQQRLPTRTIAAQLSEVTGMARQRSLRIAIDQTVKLSSQLDEERMRQAGLDEYQWHHSGKVHYRPHHKARDGHVFKWGEIPANDMPGIPPFCGCKKRAVVKFD